MLTAQEESRIMAKIRKDSYGITMTFRRLENLGFHLEQIEFRVGGLAGTDAKPLAKVHRKISTQVGKREVGRAIATIGGADN